MGFRLGLVRITGIEPVSLVGEPIALPTELNPQIVYCFRTYFLIYFSSEVGVLYD